MSTALYGTQTGSAASEKSSSNQDAAVQSSKGVSGGMIFLVLSVIAGVIIFLLAQTGGGKAMKTKFTRNVSELTGGLFGKKPEDSEP